MTDDLVKRLRDGCSCNIDSSPCMAEEECRDAYAAADRIEALEAKLAKVDDALGNIGVMGYSDDPAVVANIARMAVDMARAARRELNGGDA